MLFEQILDRAVEIFKAEQFDEDGEAMDASHAWDWALETVIRTDEDALKLATEIVLNSELKTKVTSWDAEMGSDDFAGFIRLALYMNEGFAQMVADEAPDYEVVVADRKRLVAATHERALAAPPSLPA